MPSGINQRARPSQVPISSPSPSTASGTAKYASGGTSYQLRSAATSPPRSSTATERVSGPSRERGRGGGGGGCQRATGGGAGGIGGIGGTGGAYGPCGANGAAVPAWGAPVGAAYGAGGKAGEGGAEVGPRPRELSRRSTSSTPPSRTMATSGVARYGSVRYPASMSAAMTRPMIVRG